MTKKKILIKILQVIVAVKTLSKTVMVTNIIIKYIVLNDYVLSLIKEHPKTSRGMKTMSFTSKKLPSVSNFDLNLNKEAKSTGDLIKNEKIYLDFENNSKVTTTESLGKSNKKSTETLQMQDKFDTKFENMFNKLDNFDDKSNKLDKLEKLDKIDKSDKSDMSERLDKFDSNKLEMTINKNQSDKSDKFEKLENDKHDKHEKLNYKSEKKPTIFDKLKSKHHILIDYL